MSSILLEPLLAVSSGHRHPELPAPWPCPGQAEAEANAAQADAKEPPPGRPGAWVGVAGGRAARSVGINVDINM